MKIRTKYFLYVPDIEKVECQKQRSFEKSTRSSRFRYTDRRPIGHGGYGPVGGSRRKKQSSEPSQSIGMKREICLRVTEEFEAVKKDYDLQQEVQDLGHTVTDLQHRVKELMVKREANKRKIKARRAKGAIKEVPVDCLVKDCCLRRLCASEAYFLRMGN